METARMKFTWSLGNVQIEKSRHGRLRINLNGVGACRTRPDFHCRNARTRPARQPPRRPKNSRNQIQISRRKNKEKKIHVRIHGAEEELDLLEEY